MRGGGIGVEIHNQPAGHAGLSVATVVHAREAALVVILRGEQLRQICPGECGEFPELVCTAQPSIAYLGIPF